MSKKITTKEVVERFKKVHGDEYDYSLVEYVNAKTKIKIKCKKDGHGVFEQNHSSHSRGQGCPKCGEIKVKAKLTKSTEEAIEEFIKVHGDNYDYSLVEYVNTGTRISIVCKKDGHGVFEQTPSKHLLGRGCPDCGNEKQANSQRKTKEDFIKQAKEVHPDKDYGYDKVEYKGNKNKIIIVCPVHGDFNQTPSSHLSGSGCPDCGLIVRADKKKVGIEKFIERSNIIQNNFYGYEKVVYVNAKTDVTIICPVHGEFLQTPVKHLVGRGCPDCGNEKQADAQRKPVEKFTEQANLKHKGIYKYDKVDYKNTHTNVLITCSIHGDFSQTPDNHLAGKGCEDCGNLRTADKKENQ